MSQKIKLDIISDVVCPWCIVGYKHLEAAIAKLKLEDKVDIQWQPFELNPDMPASGEVLSQHMARKYGASPQDSTKNRNILKERGQAYDFDFNFFDEMKIVNTLDAHVLLDYAEQLGKKHQLKMRLFSAYFSEQKDISDHTVLLKQAKDVGIPIEQAQLVLSDNERREKVKTTIKQWQKLGVSSVPTFVFNRSSAFSGAQPQAAFEEVLMELTETQK